jgi:signal transduction histidine kinase
MRSLAVKTAREKNAADPGVRPPWTFNRRALLPLLIVLQLIFAGFPTNGVFAEDVGQKDWKKFDQLIGSAQQFMLARPKDALDAAQRALAIAELQKQAPRYNHAAATALWLEAEALTRTSRVAEAHTAVAAASRLAASDGTITKLDGDLALSRARIAESSGEFASALKNYQGADAIFLELGIARSQSLALLGLGDLYEKAHDFDRDRRYNSEATQISPHDKAIALAAANNLGYAFEQMGGYNQAIPRFEQALTIATALKSPLLQERILNNLALSYAKVQKLQDAERAANRSLGLASKTGADEDARLSWGVRAEIEYRRADIRAAAADMQKVFRGDLKTDTPAFRDMHEIAYRVYRAKGDLPLAIAHLETFKRLDDEARSLAASANLALVGAQFDFARQDLEIAHLKSAELERDIKLRKSQAQTQLIVFVSVILAVILLLGWIVWRHALLKRHRNDIAQKNIELVKTLGERDTEIERRTEIETQLRFAMHAAEQASSAKSHFLANMSHELRTPLNAIIGFAEIIHGGHMKPEKAKEYAGDIAQGGRQLLAVLNSVLDMARIDAGKVKLEDHLIRIGNVVDHALSVLGEKNVFIGKDIRTSGDMDVVVRGDETRLQQVVINLVSNAAKFTDEGGLIEIRVERTVDGLNLIVQDNGEGIPAENLPSIMEPFVQVESAYARSHGGMGLGLPIVKSLVELHGGRFTIESEYGQGTIARLFLPRDRVVDLADETSAAAAERAA